MHVTGSFTLQHFVLFVFLPSLAFKSSSLSKDLPACHESFSLEDFLVTCIAFSSFSAPFLPPILLPYCPAGLSPHHPAFLHTFLLPACFPHPPRPPYLLFSSSFSQCTFMPVACPVPHPPYTHFFLPSFFCLKIIACAMCGA